MHEFKRTNKISGVHWLKESVENIKVRLKLKPKESIMSLPKFEDYTNETTDIEVFPTILEYTFAWQEKVFSSWEMQCYSDLDNCTTDTQLNYNNMLNITEYEPSKVFSYIHEDCYLPLPLDNVPKKCDIMNLTTCFSRLNLGKVGKMLNSNASSTDHLFRSEENIDSVGEKWMAMHIVFDSSEYDEDSNLIFKQEAILVSLYYNVIDNYLVVSPDCNNLEMNAYTVETRTGVPLEHEYAIDIQFQDEEGTSDELLILLKKLEKKWEKKHKQIVNFSMPPLGKKLHYVTFEILTASDFEMDDLYIEYNVKVPDELQCTDSLHGRTHITKALITEDAQIWNFGHPITLTLEINDSSDPPFIGMFFEVISTDWWGRHRTEGYTYLSLALEPGTHDKMLSCSRPEESDRVEAESRRFFIGGCHLIKDLDVLAKPHLKDVNFVYVTTGSIKVRWNVLSHSPTHVGQLEHLEQLDNNSVTPSTSASALLRGAEAVLRQYKRARARLAAATKDLGGEGDNVGKG